MRREQIEVDNDALDAEFNQTLSALTMQGVDLSKIRGGRRGQQRVAQAVAMESANRVLTRRALETLKSIATGEYVPPEERKKADETQQVAEDQPVLEGASPREEVTESEEAAPESERLVDPSNESVESAEADQETEPVVGDTSVDPGAKTE